MVIISISVLYSVATSIQTSLSTIFIKTYKVNQFEAGLVYLPYGAGCALAALLTGKQLDNDYNHVAKRQQSYTEEGPQIAVADFPIEAARLRNIWWPLLVAFGGTAGYGLSVKNEVVSQHWLLPI